MMTPEQVLSPTELKDGLRKLKAFLTRRKNHTGNIAAYKCVGGPYHDETIYLRTSSTMVFSASGCVGFYKTFGQVYGHFGNREVEWVPHG